jgi:uncharacterized membrane protein
MTEEPGGSAPAPLAVPATREEAQRRADRIGAFREELRALEREGALVLSTGQRAGLQAHHESLLEGLAGRFDVDRTEGQKRLSLAMRVTALLGALALAAAGYAFLYRFWGALASPAQVALLVSVPLSILAGMEAAARRERTLYVTLIAGILAVVAFVLDLSYLAGIRNVPLPPGSLLLFAAVSGLLAYAYGLRLLLVAALLLLGGFVATFTGAAELCAWHGFGRRPENFLPLAAALFFVPSVLPHRELPGFPRAFRSVGLVFLFVPLLLLGTSGHASYLPWSAPRIEALYQAAGFFLAALAIWRGTRRGEAETTNLGGAAFVVFLYVRFYEWWWNWMPRWVFFLVLGLVAVLVLLAIRRLHRARTSPGGGGR